ncbi:MAG: methyl-accepting chemotaxis protein [Alphaproteobacteria bacterium]|nr:methyl-accepting chemotaxis protein [Alphaproteobacteria bacterium]
MSYISIGKKILIVNLISLVLMIAANMFVWSMINKQALSITDVKSEVDVVTNKVSDLAVTIKDIQVNVIQVQQFLTDISATRGLDGLSDGFDKAAEAAQKFQTDWDRAYALANELNMHTVLKALEDVKAAFPSYYETGKKMANAYVAQGPEGGNALMGEFDSTAAKEGEAVAALVDITKQAMEESQKDINSHMDDISVQGNEILNLLTSMTVVSAVVVVMAVFFVQYQVVNPLTEVISAISDLSENEDSVDMQVTPRRDEVGQLVNSFVKLRDVVNNSFKLSQMVEEMPMNIMMADAKQEFKITYCNKQAMAQLTALEQYLPCKASEVIGSSFDRFHKSPVHQRAMLSDPSNLPHTARIKVGPESILLKVNAINDRHGNYIGPVAAWTVVTAQEQIATEFEQNVMGVVEIVGSSAQELSNASRSLTTAAERTSERSTSVAASAEQASANVQAVASAAEELSASIREISEQVSRSTQVSQQAKERANETTVKVSSLEQSVRRIGDVVTLISEIAEKTNLLALNATIEAARAGEAGKGFAVVANEVKSLATQTAKATQEISDHIHGVQRSTEEAVRSIHEISGIIDQMAEISTAVSSAVEEQGAATQEIARNVQEASTGTREVSTNIVTVNVAAAETGQVSEMVAHSAHDLTSQSARLKDSVSQFLERVRAAA